MEVDRVYFKPRVFWLLIAVVALIARDRVYRSFLWQTLQRTSMRTILPHLGQRFVLRAILNLVRGR